MANNDKCTDESVSDFAALAEQRDRDVIEITKRMHNQVENLTGCVNCAEMRVQCVEAALKDLSDRMQRASDKLGVTVIVKVSMPNSHSSTAKHVSLSLDSTPPSVRRGSAPPLPKRVPFSSTSTASRPSIPSNKEWPSFLDLLREFFERHDPGRSACRRSWRSRRTMEEYMTIYEAQKKIYASRSPAIGVREEGRSKRQDSSRVGPTKLPHTTNNATKGGPSGRVAGRFMHDSSTHDNSIAQSCEDLVSSSNEPNYPPWLDVRRYVKYKSSRCHSTPSEWEHEKKNSMKNVQPPPGQRRKSSRKRPENDFTVANQHRTEQFISNENKENELQTRRTRRRSRKFKSDAHDISPTVSVIPHSILPIRASPGTVLKQDQIVLERNRPSASSQNRSTRGNKLDRSQCPSVTGASTLPSNTPSGGRSRTRARNTTLTLTSIPPVHSPPTSDSTVATVLGPKDARYLHSSSAGGSLLACCDSPDSTNPMQLKSCYRRRSLSAGNRSPSSPFGSHSLSSQSQNKKSSSLMDRSTSSSEKTPSTPPFVLVKDASSSLCGRPTFTLLPAQNDARPLGHSSFSPQISPSPTVIFKSQSSQRRAPFETTQTRSGLSFVSGSEVRRAIANPRSLSVSPNSSQTPRYLLLSPSNHPSNSRVVVSVISEQDLPPSLSQYSSPRSYTPPRFKEIEKRHNIRKVSHDHDEPSLTENDTSPLVSTALSCRRSSSQSPKDAADFILDKAKEKQSYEFQQRVSRQRHMSQRHRSSPTFQRKVKSSNQETSVNSSQKSSVLPPPPGFRDSDPSRLAHKKRSGFQPPSHSSFKEFLQAECGKSYLSDEHNEQTRDGEEKKKIVKGKAIYEEKEFEDTKQEEKEKEIRKAARPIVNPKNLPIQSKMREVEAMQGQIWEESSDNEQSYFEYVHGNKKPIESFSAHECSSKFDGQKIIVESTERSRSLISTQPRFFSQGFSAKMQILQVEPDDKFQEDSIGGDRELARICGHTSLLGTYQEGPKGAETTYDLKAEYQRPSAEANLSVGSKNFSGLLKEKDSDSLPSIIPRKTAAREELEIDEAKAQERRDNYEREGIHSFPNDPETHSPVRESSEFLVDANEDWMYRGKSNCPSVLSQLLEEPEDLPDSSHHSDLHNENTAESHLLVNSDPRFDDRESRNKKGRYTETSAETSTKSQLLEETEELRDSSYHSVLHDENTVESQVPVSFTQRYEETESRHKKRMYTERSGTISTKDKLVGGQNKPFLNTVTSDSLANQEVRVYKGRRKLVKLRKAEKSPELKETAIHNELTNNAQKTTLTHSLFNDTESINSSVSTPVTVEESDFKSHLHRKGGVTEGITNKKYSDVISSFTSENDYKRDDYKILNEQTSLHLSKIPDEVRSESCKSLIHKLRESPSNIPVKDNRSSPLKLNGTSKTMIASVTSKEKTYVPSTPNNWELETHTSNADISVDCREVSQEIHNRTYGERMRPGQKPHLNEESQDEIPILQKKARKQTLFSNKKKRQTIWQGMEMSFSAEDASFVQLLEAVNDLPENEQEAVRHKLNKVIQGALVSKQSRRDERQNLTILNEGLHTNENLRPNVGAQAVETPNGREKSLQSRASTIREAFSKEQAHPKSLDVATSQNLQELQEISTAEKSDLMDLPHLATVSEKTEYCETTENTPSSLNSTAEKSQAKPCTPKLRDRSAHQGSNSSYQNKDSVNPKNVTDRSKPSQERRSSQTKRPVSKSRSPFRNRNFFRNSDSSRNFSFTRRHGPTMSAGVKRFALAKRSNYQKHSDVNADLVVNANSITNESGKLSKKCDDPEDSSTTNDTTVLEEKSINLSAKICHTWKESNEKSALFRGSGRPSEKELCKQLSHDHLSSPKSVTSLLCSSTVIFPSTPPSTDILTTTNRNKEQSVRVGESPPNERNEDPQSMLWSSFSTDDHNRIAEISCDNSLSNQSTSPPYQRTQSAPYDLNRQKNKKSLEDFARNLSGAIAQAATSQSTERKLEGGRSPTETTVDVSSDGGVASVAGGVAAGVEVTGNGAVPHAVSNEEPCAVEPVMTSGVPSTSGAPNMNNVSTVSGDLIVSNVPSVSGALKMSGARSVSGVPRISAVSIVRGSPNMSSSAPIVAGTMNMKGVPSVSGVPSVWGAPKIKSAPGQNDAPSVSASQSLTGAIWVSGTRSVSSIQSVSGAASVSGIMTGIKSENSVPNMNGVPSVSGTPIASGITRVPYVSGGPDVNNVPNVSGAPTVYSVLYVSGVPTVNNILSENGARTGNSVPNVSGVPTTNSVPNVTPAQTAKSVTSVTGVPTVNNVPNMSGAPSVNSVRNVSDAPTVSSVPRASGAQSVSISGVANTSDTRIITGIMNVNGGQNLSGVLNVSSSPIVSDTTSVSGLRNLSCVPTVNSVPNVNSVCSVSIVPKESGVLDVSGTQKASKVSCVSDVLNVSGETSANDAPNVNDVPSDSVVPNINGVVCVNDVPTVNGVTSVSAVPNVSGAPSISGVSSVSGVQSVSGVLKVSSASSASWVGGAISGDSAARKPVPRQERPPWRRVGSVKKDRANARSPSAFEKTGGVSKGLPGQENSKRNRTSVPFPEPASSSQVSPASADTCPLGNDGSLSASDTQLKPNHEKSKNKKETGAFIPPSTVVNSRTSQNFLEVSSLHSSTYFLEQCGLEPVSPIQADRQEVPRDVKKMDKPMELANVDLPSDLNAGEKRSALKGSARHNNISSTDYSSHSPPQSPYNPRSQSTVSEGSLEPLKALDLTDYNVAITGTWEEGGVRAGDNSSRNRSRNRSRSRGARCPLALHNRNSSPSGDPLGCGAAFHGKTLADPTAVTVLESLDPHAASLARAHASDPATVAAYAAARSHLPLNAVENDEDLYTELYSFLLFLYHFNPNASIVPCTVDTPDFGPYIPSRRSGEDMLPLGDDSEAEGRDDGEGGGICNSEQQEGKKNKGKSGGSSGDKQRPCGAGPNWKRSGDRKEGRSPGEKQPCQCKSKANKSLSDLKAKARSMVAAVTTVAAYAVNAARTSVPESTSEMPVMVTGVVEARCVEDAESRCVALFKKEPGKQGRVATSAGTRFSRGLILPEDITLLSVSERQDRLAVAAADRKMVSSIPPVTRRREYGLIETAIPGIKEMPRKWYGTGKRQSGVAQKIAQPCENCTCCDICKGGKCNHHGNLSPPYKEVPNERFSSFLGEGQDPTDEERTEFAGDPMLSPQDHRLQRSPKEEGPVIAEEATEDQPPQAIYTENQTVEVPPNPENNEQLDADQAVKAPEPEIAEFFHLRTEDTTCLPGAGGHVTSTAPCAASTINEDQRSLKIKAAKSAESTNWCELLPSTKIQFLSESKIMVMPQEENAYEAFMRTPTFSLMELTTDDIIFHEQNISYEKEKLSSSLESINRKQFRKEDTLVMKSLLRLDAEDLIDILLPTQVKTEPFERRKDILLNLEGFFNRCHPIMDSEDILQRTSVNFVESRELSELITPWADIDETESKKRAGKFSQKMLDNILPMVKASENKGIMEVRSLAEDYIEEVAMMSQSDHTSDARGAIRFEVFEKLETVIPLTMTFSLQKRIKMEEKIGKLMDKLIPLKEQSGEEMCHLKDGLEKLLENIMFCADVKLKILSKNEIRSEIEEYLQNIRNVTLVEDEEERASEFLSVTETFLEAMLPNELFQQSIRVGEVRKETNILLKKVILPQIEKCSTKLNYLRKIGRYHVAKILYICEQSLRRKSCILLKRSQRMLDALVPDTYSEEKGETLILNWLQNMFENIILSLCNIGSIYKKSTLQNNCLNLVESMKKYENISEENERRVLTHNTVQKFLEKILPKSDAENNVVLNKVYLELEEFLSETVPQLLTEKNQSARRFLRFLAQEHLQYIFALTEKVEKMECSFRQEINDVRLNHMITEELLKDKEERKSVLIQGISELLESIILYEDLGSSVQKRRILYHTVEKFINDIEKIEYTENKTTRSKMFHKLVHGLIETVIPYTVALDNITAHHLWENLLNLLEIPIISSFSEQNMPKRHILRFIAVEYLNNIDPGRATKNDRFIEELQNEVLEYLIPAIRITDSEKRKISLCKGIYTLLEEIITMSNGPFYLDKKTLMYSVKSFVDDTPSVENCLDKHKRKSQIFHKVEDLVQVINPSIVSGNCMHLSQLKKETIYFLETVTLAAIISDPVSRTVHRSSAMKHLQRIFLISFAPKNSTDTLERANESVNNLIPYEYRDFNEIKDSLERGLIELCEDVIVFVSETSDIQTYSELLYVVQNLMKKIQSNSEWQSLDNEVQDISGTINSFVQIILPKKESENNIVKCLLVREMSKLLTGVVYPSLKEIDLSKRSIMRALAIQHHLRIIPIIHGAHKHTKKSKETVCDLMPTEIITDQQKRLEFLSKMLQNLLENHVLPSGIGSTSDSSSIQRAIQNYFEDIEVYFLNREDQNKNKLSEINQQLLSVILPEAYCNDIRIHKLRKELNKFLETIIFFEYECCKRKHLRNTETFTLISLTSQNLDNIFAVIDIIRNRKNRLVTLESRKFVAILSNLYQNGGNDNITGKCARETNEAEILHSKIADSLSSSQNTTHDSSTEETDHSVEIYHNQEDCTLETLGDSTGITTFEVTHEENDNTARTDLSLSKNDSSSKSFKTSDGVKSHPVNNITCYFFEEMSNGRALQGDAQLTDRIIISTNGNAMDETQTKLLDQIIPEAFEVDELKRQNSLKSGMKYLLENVLIGARSSSNVNKKIEDIVEKFINTVNDPKVASNNCRGRKLLVTDLVEEIIPSSSEESRDFEIREETKTLIESFIIPAISVQDIVKRNSLRLLAKEHIEKIIEEPRIPEYNYLSIMEKIFPDEEDEMGNLLVSGIIELLEIVILFIHTQSPIQRKTILHTTVQEFRNDMLKATAIRNEEIRIREKSLYILELVIKVIPDYIAEDNVLIHRLQTELSHFFDIIFINETYQNAERKQQKEEAQKILEKIFSIISILSRRDSGSRYQKYCEILDKLIPEEHLCGAPGMFSTVLRGIEELMENIILSMETQSDIEKRSELRMVVGAFMKTLQDLKVVGSDIPDRAKKSVVADFIKKIFPNASNKGNIHLFEVRKNLTNLLYNAVVVALDEEDTDKRKHLRSVAQEHLDSITLVGELWRRCIVTENEVIDLVDKLVPGDSSKSKEIRIRNIQLGIEVLIEKMILSLEDGRGINMSSVHKFIQIMIDNISEFKDETLMSERKYQIHKYIKHLIDGIISEEEADDDIKKEKLRHIIIEILEYVLNVFLENSSPSLSWTVVQNKLQMVLLIIRVHHNKKLKNQIKKQLIQPIEELIPQFYVELKSGREIVLNNAIVQFISEVYFPEKSGKSSECKELTIKVQRLITEMSSIGHVKNLIERRRLTKKCVSNFINKLLNEENASVNEKLRTISCELQRFLEDVVLPAQTEKSYSKRQLLREEGLDLLQHMLVLSRTAWKEIQLDEKRTIDIVDNMMPRVFQSNPESRENSLFNALFDVVEKITSSDVPVMIDDRIVHSKILEYVHTLLLNEDDSGTSTNEDVKMSLRKIIYDIILLITNSLSQDKTDIRLISSCIEDLLFNIVPDGQYIHDTAQRIMLRSEARQLLDMVFFENDSSQEKDISGTESDKSGTQTVSRKSWSPRPHKKKKKKAILSFFFRWIRRKTPKNSEEKKNKKVSKKKRKTEEGFSNM